MSVLTEMERASADVVLEYKIKGKREERLKQIQKSLQMIKVLNAFKAPWAKAISAAKNDNSSGGSTENIEMATIHDSRNEDKSQTLVTDLDQGKQTEGVDGHDESDVAELETDANDGEDQEAVDTNYANAKQIAKQNAQHGSPRQNDEETEAHENEITDSEDNMETNHSRKQDSKNTPTGNENQDSQDRNEGHDTSPHQSPPGSHSDGTPDDSLNDGLEMNSEDQVPDESIPRAAAMCKMYRILTDIM